MRSRARLSLGQAAATAVYADIVLAAASVLSIPYLISGLGTEGYGVIGLQRPVG